MTVLNKDKNFITHIGKLKGNVKYEQDGYTFDPSGKYLGKIGGNKPAVKKPAKPAIKSAPKAQPKTATETKDV